MGQKQAFGRGPGFFKKKAQGIQACILTPLLDPDTSMQIHINYQDLESDLFGVSK